MSKPGKYPRLGTSWTNDRSNKHCRVIGCPSRATVQQFVEYSWFRGDDEHIWICGKRNHSSDAIIATCEEVLRCRAKT